MKKNVYASIIALTIVLILFACNPQQGQGSPTSTKMVEIPQTPINPSTAAPTKIRTPITLPTNTQEAVSFPLAEGGPYFAGDRVYTFNDDSRNGRMIVMQIYYPALKNVNDAGDAITRDAAPDLSGAPYPLILTGTNSGRYLFKSHLASYGFVMVIVQSLGFSYEAPWDNSVIDAPLDFLFVLDRLTSNPPEGLENVVDTNRVGVAGYSSDGLFSLALGGARVNPAYYFSECAQAPTMDPPIPPFLIEYYCNLSERWDEFSSQVSPRISTVTDGLWQPTTDDRILAVMPMAPDSAWLYGPEGLAAIDIPALIIAGTADDLVSYKMTSCYVYDHLVNSDRVLISFIGKQHMMVDEQQVISQIDHFAVAFFGTYLQGREDLSRYFSEEFVTQSNDLAWGVYEK
jgi:predicted dienelactone hydrolase